MPHPPPMSPDVRDSIKGYLRASIKAFFKELATRYFSHAESPEARQALLEANAEALHELMQDEPHGPATLTTFATELLDKEQHK